MNLRRTTTALLASVLALSLIAATEPTAPRGTASTSLTALELGVTGVPGVTVVDLGSYASTDTDLVRNAIGNGSPFGWVAINPVALGETVFGATEARSDAQNNVTTELVSASDPAGLVSALVNPVGLSATADATSAVGAAQAATAQLSALNQALGLVVNTTGVVSSVSDTAATATQGLRVEGLDIDLGDLVPLDVLALLPIDVLIELLDQLPVGVPDIEGIVDTALDAVDDAEAAAAAITGAGEQLATDLVALADANQVLADAEAVLAAAQDAEATAQAALDAAAVTLAAAQAVAAEIANDLDSLDAVALLTKYGTQCVGATVLTIVTCVEGLLDDAQAAVATAQADVDAAQAALNDAVDAVQAVVADVQTAQDAVDALQAAINTVVDALQQLVDDVIDALIGLVDALTTLEGSLGDVVAALADGDILSVGAIDIGVVANSIGTIEGSSATVGCSPVPIEVLGLHVATPDCSNPLTSVSSLANAITGSIQGLLQTLPVVQDVLPEVSIEVFPVVQESVVQDGDYVTATAHVVPLDVALGSVTIDPANLVSGLLATLAAQVDALVAAAIPADEDVADLGLPAEITDTLAAVRDQLPEVSDLQALLDAVLALLPDGLDLPTVATPAIDLRVDPTSASSFAPGAPGSPDTSGPAPAPGDDPSLPTTGGGLALLGLLSLGGAISLRRRR
ncbi:MAG TPA: hypothetical protein VGA69_09195 [Nitriliruptorales bacterium]